MITPVKKTPQQRQPKTKKSAKPTYHHGDLARALVTAGRQILVEKGTDGLSLRAVAAKVGVSQTAPYSHFGSKRELLRAISASGFAELTEKMETSAKADASAKETVLDYGVAYIEFATRNPDVYRLMFAKIDANARSNHRTDIKSKSDILNMEATRAYNVLFDLFKTNYTDEKQAISHSLGAWGLVHGLASLISEGLISAPEIDRKIFIRELLSNQIRISS